MARVVTCWSPYHGQGATWVALLAAAATMRKQRTLLIDANFFNPMLSSYLGIESSHHIEQLFPYIAGQTLSQEVFQQYVSRKGALHVLVGMGRKELSQEDQTAHYFMEILKHASYYDQIIIDAGAGIDHAGSYAAIAAADVVMIVMEPNFLIAKQLKRWQFNIDEELPKALHAPKAGLILNRWEKKLHVTKDEIANYCGLPVWATLPNDHLFLNALNKGELWKYSGESIWMQPLSRALQLSQEGGGR